MEIIAALPWPQLGWGVIIAVAIIMIFRGHLVPERYYSDVQKERDTWREAAETSENARDEERRLNIEQSKQLEELTSQMSTIVHIVESLPNPEKEGRL